MATHPISPSPLAHREAAPITAAPGFTAVIVERPAPGLRAFAGGLVTPDLRLLNRPLAVYQLACLRRHGASRVIFLSAGDRPPTLADLVTADDPPGRSILVLDANVLTDADVSAMLHVHAELAPAATVMLAAAPGTASGLDRGVVVVDVRHVPWLLARRSGAQPDGAGAMLRAAGLACAHWCSPAYTRRLDTPAAYRAAHMDLLDGRAALLVTPPGRAADGCWIGDGVSLGPDAAIVPPSVIGAGTELRAGTRVGPRAVIGGHGCLEPGARVAESVLGDGVLVGANATLDGCVVGSGARIAPFSILAPGAVLGRGAVLRSRTVLPR